ncbi:unnamed protein product [Oppiella nova]|uniref:Protein Wnt n=1 Tax=Oppiella nova TaxID=334625 RepID=A0A7R9M008_9ACAR|nr:unnamed protein product [Oppiella nova]CAG2168621.1 unnamed protein product [Oppiella nova]
MPGLDRLQRHYCRHNPAIIESIAAGVRLGIRECQLQFRHYQWNCSTNGRDLTLFGRQVLSALSRETAFIYAITSAGVVHSIARWCSAGQLPNCACDPRRVPGRRGRDLNGEFAWGGCSQYIRFATLFARKFVDRQDRHVRDAMALMHLHNNRVGRKIVLKNARLVCKCHGVSASCLVRTCWRITGDFRAVSSQLMAKYAGAKRVKLVQTRDRYTGAVRRVRGANRLGQGGLTYTQNELIYLDTSPDYCNVSHKYGFSGTEGRVCNKTSTSAADSCDIICCGSGYRTQRLTVRYKCRCRFYWCCHVKCQVQSIRTI